MVAGDGDFSMVVQELETAARESLPVTVVVFNDSELSSIKTQQAAHYEERFIGVDYTDVDFAAVAEGFNATGHRVETGAAFEAALDAALAADSPSVVDVRTDPTIEAPSLFYESES
jgi:acetolactate synthase-1/2/3 large subunit